MTGRSIALTDTAGLVDGSRLDAHLAALGVNNPWAVGTHETRFRLALESIHDLVWARRRNRITALAMRLETHLDLVLLGNTLRNGDDETNLVLDGLEDGIRRGGWWYVEDGGVGLDFPHGITRFGRMWGSATIIRSTYLLHRSKDGETEMGLPRLLGVDTTDHPSAILERLFYMESAL